MLSKYATYDMQYKIKNSQKYLRNFALICSRLK